MRILDNIREYVKKNPVAISVILVLIATVFFMGRRMHSLSIDNRIKDVNLKAATEEIQEYKLKNGELLAEKQSYITNINELENYLDISKKEIKELQKTLNNKIMYISDLEAQVKITPTEVHDTTVVYKDSTFNFTFKFSDEWYSLQGNSSFDYKTVKTKINELYVDVPLNVGLTDDFTIFVKTPNPYVTFGKIEGALLDKDMYLRKNKPQRRVGIGVYGGMNAGWDMISNRIYIGPGVGVGVYIRLL